MKYLFVVLMGITIVSCSKTGSTLDNSTEPIAPIDSTSSKVLWEGVLENGFYGKCSGKAVVYRNGSVTKLRLEDFSVSTGPDLKVYFSKEAEPLNFYSLGSLKAFTGTQEYTISSNIDFELFKYVVIHCERFNHQFGKSLLRMP